MVDWFSRARVINDAPQPTNEIDRAAQWEQACQQFTATNPRPGAHVACRWCRSTLREFTILRRADGQGLAWCCRSCGRRHMSEREWVETPEAKEEARREVEARDLARSITDRRTALEVLGPKIDAELRQLRRSVRDDAFIDAVMADKDLSAAIIKHAALKVLVYD